MTEVLVEFDTVMTASDGTRWVPRACGRPADDGLWEGWIEFLGATDETLAIRSPRETEQHNRDDVMYWAQGLTETYLEGALSRALDEGPEPSDREVQTRPVFDGPAPRAADTPRGVAMRPVLNPFEVFQQGESILLQELTALSPGRLRDIVIAYGFAAPEHADGAGREELTTFILTGVRRTLASPPSDEEPDAREAL